MIVGLLGAGSAAAESVQPYTADATVAGQVMVEYPIDWWRWVYAAPRSRNPISDRSGEHCAVNQSGDVWFLAGAWGVDRVIRYCTVPAGKHLFFPMINVISFANGDGEPTCGAMLQGVVMRNTERLSIWLRVNGETVDNAGMALAPQSCFGLVGPRNARGKGRTGYPAATSGYWVMLPPLPPGEHTLEFGARDTSNESEAGRFIQDIEYVITVSDDTAT